jgi:hypothetical protein
MERAGFFSSYRLSNTTNLSEASDSRTAKKIRFTKQYKPIGFSDRPNPDTVEGPRNAMAEAVESRKYNRRIKQLEAEDTAKPGGLLARVKRFLK